MSRKQPNPPPRGPRPSPPPAPPAPPNPDFHATRSADFARRVAVEQHLLEAAGGKRPLPDAKTCLALAHQLGIPDEYR